MATINGREYDLHNPAQRLSYWNAKATELLAGRTITAAEYIVDDEWGYVLVAALDNGSEFFVSGDDEGNGPGALNFGDKGILPQLW